MIFNTFLSTKSEEKEKKRRKEKIKTEREEEEEDKERKLLRRKGKRKKEPFLDPNNFFLGSHPQIWLLLSNSFSQSSFLCRDAAIVKTLVNMVLFPAVFR